MVVKSNGTSSDFDNVNEQQTFSRESIILLLLRIFKNFALLLSITSKIISVMRVLFSPLVRNLLKSGGILDLHDLTSILHESPRFCLSPLFIELSL